MSELLKFSPEETRILNRFNFYYYVSHKNKFIYVNNFKVASTAFINAIVDIEDLKEPPPSYPPFYHPPHRILSTGLVFPELSRLIENKGYLAFAATRHPILRLFSSWGSTFLGFNNSLRLFYSLSEKDRTAENIRLLFDNYVQALHDNPVSRLEVHCIPQYIYLRIDKVKYTHLLKIEEVDFFIDDLYLRFRVAKNPTPHLNLNYIPYEADYISAKSANIIYKIYEADFRIFGYDKVVPSNPTGAPIEINYLGLKEKLIYFGLLGPDETEKTDKEGGL